MEAEDEGRIAASFPAPPPFWKEFTEESLTQISTLRNAQSPDTSKTIDPSKTLPPRILDLPSELRYLQPPEPPTEGIYRCFGDVWNLNNPLPSLEEGGIQQLYTPPSSPTTNGKHSDRAFILKKLAKSLLLNFLELVGIMSVNPDNFSEKIQDLRTLFINFHHLLNEYRPHQARESLILMMQEQLERSKAETKGIMDMKEKVEGILEGLDRASVGEEKWMDGNVGMKEKGGDVWEELEREFS